MKSRLCEDMSGIQEGRSFGDRAELTDDFDLKIEKNTILRGCPNGADAA